MTSWSEVGQATANGASSATPTLGTAASAGNLLILYFDNQSTTPTVSTGWTKIDLVTTGGTSTRAGLYYKVASGGETSVTVTGSVVAAIIARFTTTATVGAVDVSAHNTGSTTSPTVSSLTTTSNDDLLLFGAGVTGSSSFTPPSGYSLIANAPRSTTLYAALSWTTQATAGATGSVAATLGSSANWSAVLAAFSATAGASGSFPPFPPHQLNAYRM